MQNPAAIGRGILVLQGVVRVRICRDDVPELARLDELCIVLSEGLEKALFSNPPNIVARVPLALAEDAKIYRDSREDLCGLNSHLLAPRVERRVVAYKPQVLHGLPRRVLNPERDSLGPRPPILRRSPEPVAVAAEARERRLPPLLPLAPVDQVPSHLNDERNVLDLKRTSLHACETRGAGPDRVGLDGVAHKGRATVPVEFPHEGAKLDHESTRG